MGRLEGHALVGNQNSKIERLEDCHGIPSGGRDERQLLIVFVRRIVQVRILVLTLMGRDQIGLTWVHSLSCIGHKTECMHLDWVSL